MSPPSERREPRQSYPSLNTLDTLPIPDRIAFAEQRLQQLELEVRDVRREVEDVMGRADTIDGHIVRLEGKIDAQTAAIGAPPNPAQGVPGSGMAATLALFMTETKAYRDEREKRELESAKRIALIAKSVAWTVSVGGGALGIAKALGAF